MFLENDSSPENDVYYLGSELIEILDSTKDRVVDFFDTYQKLNSVRKVSMNLFIFTIDWLFILGLVKKSTKGNIEKCF